MVREFDAEEIAEECFGGEETWGASTMGYRNSTVKTRNAYLLFYERKSDYEPEESDEEQEEEGPVEKEKPEEEAVDIKMKNETEDAETEVCQIKDGINLDNQRYWQHKFLFSSAYVDFTIELTSFWNTNKMIPYMYPSRVQDEAIYGIDPNSIPKGKRCNAFKGENNLLFP